MTMGERIRELRQMKRMTQKVFAEAIGTTQNSIASYETNRRLPSAAALNNICKTFDVNEKWLKNGEGNMMTSPLAKSELVIWAERLAEEDDDYFPKQVALAMARLSPQDWRTLKDILGKVWPTNLRRDNKTQNPVTPTPTTAVDDWPDFADMAAHTDKREETISEWNKKKLREVEERVRQKYGQGSE